ncbi:MAG: hypothetical protein AAGD38_11880 [Acidobacteriota bacterium]
MTFTKRWLVATFLLIATLLLVATLTAHAADDDTARLWVERHVEALGGSEVLATLSTMRGVGTYSTSADEAGARFTQVWVSPDKLLFESPGRERLGTDGQVNWLWDPENKIAIELPMIQAARYLRLASAGGPLALAYRRGLDIHAGGREERGGVEAQVLTVEYGSGDHARFYLHPETALLLEVEEIWRIGENEAVIRVRYDDYRDVTGLRVPFSSRQETSQGWRHFTFETLEINVDLDADRFSKPS